MPTGFTHKVADGTEPSFRTFALRCARGMGALITMRDDASDAEIPRQLTADIERYDRQIAESMKRMDELRAMTTEETYAAAADAHHERLTAWTKRQREDREKYDRYTAMIAETEAWQGAPEGLKELMLDQLQRSRDFDCTYPEASKYDVEPKLQSGEEWRAEQFAEVARSLQWDTKYRAEEIERTAGRNAWLAQLFAALPEDETK